MHWLVNGSEASSTISIGVLRQLWMAMVTSSQQNGCLWSTTSVIGIQNMGSSFQSAFMANTNGSGAKQSSG